jgi:CheY-like chemotaxis protein
METVLIIEDDATMVVLLETLLDIEGFSVVAPPSAGSEDLVPLLAKVKPDVAFIDIHLKKTNGLDLLRCIRQDQELNCIKIVMTSGIDLGSKCIAEGADAFLLKPYMPEDLVRLIRKVIAK